MGLFVRDTREVRDTRVGILAISSSSYVEADLDGPGMDVDDALS